MPPLKKFAPPLQLAAWDVVRKSGAPYATAVKPPACCQPGGVFVPDESVAPGLASASPLTMRLLDVNADAGAAAASDASTTTGTIHERMGFTVWGASAASLPSP